MLFKNFHLRHVNVSLEFGGLITCRGFSITRIDEDGNNYTSVDAHATFFLSQRGFNAILDNCRVTNLTQQGDFGLLFLREVLVSTAHVREGRDGLSHLQRKHLLRLTLPIWQNLIAPGFDDADDGTDGRLNDSSDFDRLFMEILLFVAIFNFHELFALIAESLKGLTHYEKLFGVEHLLRGRRGWLHEPYDDRGKYLVNNDNLQLLLDIDALIPGWIARHAMNFYSANFPLEELVADRQRSNQEKTRVSNAHQWLITTLRRLHNTQDYREIVAQTLEELCDVTSASAANVITDWLREDLRIAHESGQWGYISQHDAAAEVFNNLTREITLDVHHDNEAALVSAVISKNTAFGIALIEYGANLSVARSALRGELRFSGKCLSNWELCNINDGKPVDDSVNQILKYCQTVYPLHETLRGETSVPESEYAKYYNCTGCVKAAQLQLGFEAVQKALQECERSTRKHL